MLDTPSIRVIPDTPQSSGIRVPSEHSAITSRHRAPLGLLLTTACWTSAFRAVSVQSHSTHGGASSMPRTWHRSNTFEEGNAE